MDKALFEISPTLSLDRITKTRIQISEYLMSNILYPY
jgi:hypothetical protein